MVSQAPWKEIVFLGDLLDANLSTLTKAIEGGISGGAAMTLCGFRQFIKELDAGMREQSQGKQLKDLAEKWIYVPGNHDYKIWDILSSRLVCEDVLSAGRSMGWVPTPLMRYQWQGDDSFFAGIFRPYATQDHVSVEYPNHEVYFGQECERMVMTHGHYLDRAQTRWSDLADRFLNAKTSEEVHEARRSAFIETAQYQTVANAVSFTKGWRGIINLLVGPDAVGNKFWKLCNQFGSRVLSVFFPAEERKGRQLSAKQLLNLGCYLKQFCQSAEEPRWFIFGHTHHQGREATSMLHADVYNAGSCYWDRGMPITFAEINTDSHGMPIIHLMCVNENVKVTKTNWSA